MYKTWYGNVITKQAKTGLPSFITVMHNRTIWYLSFLSCYSCSNDLV